MSNNFYIPTEEECTINIVDKDRAVPCDVMEVYEMHLQSQRTAQSSKSSPEEVVRQAKDLFRQEFKERYDVELTYSATTLLIQRVSVIILGLKKKCVDLPSLEDSTVLPESTPANSKDSSQS